MYSYVGKLSLPIASQSIHTFVRIAKGPITTNQTTSFSTLPSDEPKSFPVFAMLAAVPVDDLPLETNQIANWLGPIL